MAAPADLLKDLKDRIFKNTSNNKRFYIVNQFNERTIRFIEIDENDQMKGQMYLTMEPEEIDGESFILEPES